MFLGFHWINVFVLTITICICFCSINGEVTNDCVLNANGSTDCTESSSKTISSTNRFSSPPCHRHDTMCWNRYTLMYTNRLRRKYGKPILGMGTYNQLRNAVNRAKVLATKYNNGPRPKLTHQNLYRARQLVGCKRWMGGENLAYNHEKYNIARKCVDQWIRSKKHFHALITEWFREMVIGVHVTKSGRVFCVQTFAVYSEKYTFGTKYGPGCSVPRIWERHFHNDDDDDDDDFDDEHSYDD